MQPHFGPQTCNIINNFLDSQRKPICFVAHNGNYFDYPILKAELHKAGCELIDNILCIDSLQMFRELDKAKTATTENPKCKECLYVKGESDQFNQRNVEVDMHNLPTQKNIPIELCDEYDELLFSVVDGVEMSSIKNAKEVQSLNENTPKKLNNTTHQNNNTKIINALQDHLYYTPSSNNRSNQPSTSTHVSDNNTVAKSTTRRKLNFG